jgi:3-deoxy-D-manno-octulosonic-acid transferase
MSVVLNLLYLGALLALSPWLLWRAVRTGRYRRDLAAKLWGVRKFPENSERPVWFHGVSVGEIHLLTTLIAAFRRRHPHRAIVVSSTTDTGLNEARQRFPNDTVIPYPFDFSWAVANSIQAIQPALIVLAESEMWPNFLAEAQSREIPVVLVNGRMSPRSFRRLRLVAGLARRWLFRRVNLFAMQSEDYAQRLQQLGVPPEKIVVTGSVKYDGATGERETPKSRELRQLFGLIPAGVGSESPLIWLAGSTHSPEEEIVLRVFGRLSPRFPQLRLILVPRHPDRFAEVASRVEASGHPFVRRSQIHEPLSSLPLVVLLDSIGELGAAWSLAHLGFTGGSLDGRRGGQSMIEPAGYGVPTLFGPHVWNFRDAARRLVEVGGAFTIANEAELENQLALLIANPELREQMGRKAREFVVAQQGATAKTLDALDPWLAPGRSVNL